MEKNYYQILEVDKNASEEVIDKAYKTLAKKYHPDLQNEENHLYEEKMKAINEAYEVLADDFKRANYDAQLQENTISPEQYQEILAENIELKRQIERLTNPYQTVNSTQYRVQQNKVENQNTYVRRRRDFRQYKSIIKEYRNVIIGLVIGIVILLLISQIPFVKKYLIQLYEKNIIIKAIVDIFVNTFTTGF